jgi:hypothetical protein
MTDFTVEPAPLGTGKIVDGRWLLEDGVDNEGDRGASVADMSPPRDDASEIQYAYKRADGVYLLFLVVVHRHSMAGECEQVPWDDYGHGVPEEVGRVLNELTDAPVATREGGG